MAISSVGSITAKNDNPVTTQLTIGTPSGAQAGDIVVYWVSNTNSGAQIAQSQGPALTACSQANLAMPRAQLSCWVRKLTASDLTPQYQFTSTAQGKWLAIGLLIRGGDLPIDMHPMFWENAWYNMETMGMGMPKNGVKIGLFGAAKDWSYSDPIGWILQMGTKLSEISNTGTGDNTATIGAFITDVSANQAEVFRSQVDFNTGLPAPDNRFSCEVLIPEAAAVQLDPLTSTAGTTNCIGAENISFSPVVNGAAGAVSYGSWTKASGTTPASLTTSGGAATVIMPVAGGSAVFEIVCTDAAGRSVTAKHTVNAAKRRQLPWATSPVGAGWTATNSSSDATTVVADLIDTSGTAISGTGTQVMIGADALPDSIKTDGLTIIIEANHTGNINLLLQDKNGASSLGHQVAWSGRQRKRFDIPADSCKRLVTLEAGWKLSVSTS